MRKKEEIGRDRKRHITVDVHFLLESGQRSLQVATRVAATRRVRIAHDLYYTAYDAQKAHTKAAHHTSAGGRKLQDGGVECLTERKTTILFSSRLIRSLSFSFSFSLRSHNFTDLVWLIEALSHNSVPNTPRHPISMMRGLEGMAGAKEKKKRTKKEQKKEKTKTTDGPMKSRQTVERIKKKRKPRLSRLSSRWGWHTDLFCFPKTHRDCLRGETNGKMGTKSINQSAKLAPEPCPHSAGRH